MNGKEGVLSSAGSPNRIMIVPTNEELVIALDTMELVN
jgi:acetate kinase